MSEQSTAEYKGAEPAVTDNRVMVLESYDRSKVRHRWKEIAKFFLYGIIFTLATSILFPSIHAQILDNSSELRAQYISSNTSLSTTLSQQLEDVEPKYERMSIRELEINGSAYTGMNISVVGYAAGGDIQNGEGSRIDSESCPHTDYGNQYIFKGHIEMQGVREFKEPVLICHTVPKLVSSR